MKKAYQGLFLDTLSFLFTVFLSPFLDFPFCLNQVDNSSDKYYNKGRYETQSYHWIMNTDKYSYEQKEQHINLLSQYPRFFFFFSCSPCHTPTNISTKQMKNIVKPNAQQSLVFIHEMNSNNSITPIVIPIIPSFFTDSAAKLRIT